MVLLLLNEHGDPYFYFQIQVPMRQSLTKIPIQVLFLWNDLKRDSVGFQAFMRDLLCYLDDLLL